MRLDARTLRRFHIYADVFLVGIGWISAYAIRFHLNDVLGRDINSFSNYVNALPLIVPPWILSCGLFGVYQSTRMTSAIDQIQALLKGVVLGLLVVSSIGFFVKEFDFGRSVVLASTAINGLLQGLSRSTFHRIERRLRTRGSFDVPSLILGAGVTGVRLLQKLQDHPETGYRVVGFLDDAPALAGDTVANRPVLGRVEDLHKVVAEHDVSEVFVAIPSLDHDRLLSFGLECEDQGVTFRMVTDVFEVLTSETHIDLIDDLPLVRLQSRHVHAWYEATKRISDLAVSAAALVLTAPLWLWIGLRIRLDSRGPILFRHTRIGQSGEPFRMYKFRTMVADAHPDRSAPTSRSDPRITRYGRWLRRSSLDELPQLLNVIGGSMSLVGPRPEMPFIVETYQGWQRRRLSVKPGITGLWQILGRKGLPMHDNLQYDFYYIHNRSLLFDLSILLRTIGVVLSRKGAF